jgi:PAS domain S-box-containing protein
MNEIESTIENQEERYRELLKGIVSEVMFKLGSENQVVSINSQVSVLFGYQPKEMVGLNFSQFIHPNDLMNVFEGLKINMESRDIFQKEFRFRHKDGRFISVLGKGRFTNEGEDLIFAGILRDITEKKELDNLIKDRLDLEKTISLIASHFVGIKEYDNAINASLKNIGELCDANRVFLLLYDEDRTSLIDSYEWCANDMTPQTEFLRNIPINNFPWWNKQYEKFSYVKIEDVSLLQQEAKNTRDLLEFLESESLLSIPIYARGKLAGFIGVSRKKITTQWKYKDFTVLRVFSQIFNNILERKWAEEALRESEAMLKATFEAIVDGILAINENGFITHVNTKFTHMWQISKDLINRRDAKVLFNKMKDQLKNPQYFISKVHELKASTSTMFDVFSFKDGRIFDSYSFPLYRGEVMTGRVWSFRDITEHQHAEEELRKSEEMYRKAYDRANFYKNIFTHDINNILHNINLSVELLPFYQNNPEHTSNFEEMVDIIKKSVERGGNLVTTVRKLSEIEESEIQIQSTGCRQVLDEAIKFLRKSVPNKELFVKVDAPEKEINVLANELLLDAFENILGNAAKYNINPIIEIIVKISRVSEKSQNYVKVEFIDNGIGVPDKSKQAIFQKGYKKDSKVRGLGMGLSLVKKIIEIYNGKIWIEDKVEGDHSQGSNFILLIPEAS